MPKASQQSSTEFNHADGVTLKEHIEMRLEEMDKANILARQALEARLESMNEFRAAMQDQQGKFLPRMEYDIYHQKIVDDLKNLQRYQATMEGKASQQSVNITLFISIVSLILAFVGILEKLFIK